MKLILTNTLTRKKESFVPLKDKNVGMYVCGVTPYADSHIGHGRCYVNFDILFRLLKFLQYDVTYVRNITDIDDKLINKAKEETGNILDYLQISQKYTKNFWNDMQELNNLKPTYEPKVTENIQEIIKFISSLIEKKHAYVLGADVYFDVLSFEKYGKLSGKKLEDLKLGSRIEVDERKKHPADFVLWKGNGEKLFWESPWGYGRPGWHIECSVMAQKYLGQTLDIHGGGMDLIFPHHENEVAQSEAHNLNVLSKYWIHNAFINVNKEKMSKSLGNFFTLKTVFQKFDPMILRFYFLQHHYRTPIEFTLQSLNAAKAAYEKLVVVFENVNILKEITISDCESNSLLSEMLSALCDDLNTPKFLGILFENLSKIKESQDLAVLVKTFVNAVVGLKLDAVCEKFEITPEIEDLIKKREQARIDKNWALADEIRGQLLKLGYEVQDKKIK
ncbi:cysteine--tRNA ligase [Candidatus Dependentiae bacterium]|nr:cysteine--tRNA ligase [Candidatus Dependentiae bacterium]MBU4387181.1 cysteine--tRNA ligase [Candidatus Dependentiae bacterium]MCG2755996.1 cysteine--tRNA ligase [Candidatus Dependentiae bacterium]